MKHYQKQTIRKIAFLLGGFTSNGGIGRVVSIIGNSLSKVDGIEIFFLCYGDWDETKFIYQISREIHGEGLHKSCSMTKTMLTGGAQELRAYLKKHSIDILFACGALYFPISVIACRSIQTKCVCWEHSNANNSADHKLQKLSRSIGAKFGDTVLVLTKQDFDFYVHKYNPSKMYQIYNPIDPVALAYSKKQEKSRKIISVGRLTYQKDPVCQNSCQ